MISEALLLLLEAALMFPPDFGENLGTLENHEVKPREREAPRYRLREFLGARTEEHSGVISHPKQ